MDRPHISLQIDRIEILHPKKVFNLSSDKRHLEYSELSIKSHFVSLPKRILRIDTVNRFNNLRWIVYLLMFLNPMFLAVGFIWFDIDPPDLRPLVSSRFLASLSIVLFSFLSTLIFFITKSVSTDFTEVDEKFSALNIGGNEYFMDNFASRKKFYQHLFLCIQLIASFLFIPHLAVVSKSSSSLKWSNLPIVLDIIKNWYQTMVIHEKFYDLIMSSLVVSISFESLLDRIKRTRDHGWTSDVLNSYRETYLKIIDLTVAVNRIWTTYLGFIYPMVPMFGVMFLYWFLMEPKYSVRIIFLISTSVCIFTIFHSISRNLIAINVQAASIYDPIFRTISFNQEIEYIVQV